METTAREPRPEKVATVAEVSERLTSANAAILTEYRGLHVKQMQELRRALASAGGEYKVYKNTLVRRAAAESGLDVLDSLLEGPTAIAFIRDDIGAVAKVLRDFGRANPSLVVKGGLIGSSFVDAQGATALADLPSREALLAQIAGIFAAPLQRFAGMLSAVPQKFAYALNALIESKPAEAAPESPAAESPAAESPAAERPETADAPQAEAPQSESATAPAEEPDIEAGTTAAPEPDVEGDTTPADEPDVDTETGGAPASEPN